MSGRPVARLALSPDEASEALGVSRDYFDKHVAHELRIVRRGRRKLVPVRELERWLDREAAVAVGIDRLSHGAHLDPGPRRSYD
jgi:excisionase family DNA binding protein